MPEFKPFRLSEAVGDAQNMAVNTLRLNEAGRQVQARNSLTDALQSGTPEAMSSYRREFPVEASQFDATQAQANIQKMQTIGLRADVMGRLASGVTDETSYQRALQQAKEAGIDVSGAPPNYDPNFVKQFMEQAMTTKQRIDAGIKGAEFELKRREQAERERHNRATEVIQRSKAAADKSGVKTAVYNSANASTATLFGGVYDPQTGRISGLDKTSSQRALQVSARAQEILTEGNIKEPAAAVKMAAKEMGIDLGDKAQSGNAQDVRLPAGVPPPDKRSVGFKSPDGKYIWSGTGWKPAN